MRGITRTTIAVTGFLSLCAFQSEEKPPTGPDADAAPTVAGDSTTQMQTTHAPAASPHRIVNLPTPEAENTAPWTTWVSPVTVPEAIFGTHTDTPLTFPRPSWLAPRSNGLHLFYRDLYPDDSAPLLTDGSVRLNLDGSVTVDTSMRRVILVRRGRSSLWGTSPFQPDGPEGSRTTDLICGSDPLEIGQPSCGWPSFALSNISYTNFAVESSSNIAVPFLPWPPPAPSSMVNLSNRVSISGRFGMIARRLEAHLTERQYENILYYGVPGGFAITTEPERYEASGHPATENRFRVGRVGGWHGFWDYVSRLVLGEQGSYRVFVFVVTSVPFTPASYPATDQDVRRWRSAGSFSLPPQVASIIAPNNTTVHVLIYEFEGSLNRAGGLVPARQRLASSYHLTWLGF